MSSFRQNRNKLNMFNLFRLGRKNRSTCSIRQCCFDIVAGVDGALNCYYSLLYAVALLGITETVHGSDHSKY